jgi:hypothetical protein
MYDQSMYREFEPCRYSSLDKGNGEGSINSRHWWTSSSVYIISYLQTLYQLLRLSNVEWQKRGRVQRTQYWLQLVWKMYQQLCVKSPSSEISLICLTNFLAVLKFQNLIKLRSLRTQMLHKMVNANRFEAPVCETCQQLEVNLVHFWK